MWDKSHCFTGKTANVLDLSVLFFFFLSILIVSVYPPFFLSFFLKLLNPSDLLYIIFTKFLGDPLFYVVLFHSQVHLICHVKQNCVGKTCQNLDWWRGEVVSKLEFRWTGLKWRLCWFFLTYTNGMKISSE